MFSLRYENECVCTGWYLSVADIVRTVILIGKHKQCEHGFHHHRGNEHKDNIHRKCSGAEAAKNAKAAQIFQIFLYAWIIFIGRSFVNINHVLSFCQISQTYTGF